MTIYRNEGSFDTSNVESANGVILRYDKKEKTSDMRYIDYGLGAFHRDAFANNTPGQIEDLAAIYQRLLAAGDLAAFEVPERFYEIGSPAGIRDLEAHLS